MEHDPSNSNSNLILSQSLFNLSIPIYYISKAFPVNVHFFHLQNQNLFRHAQINLLAGIKIISFQQLVGFDCNSKTTKIYFKNYYQKYVRNSQYDIIIFYLSSVLCYRTLNKLPYFTSIISLNLLYILMAKDHVLSLDFVERAIHNPLMNEKCCNLHDGNCLQRSIQHFLIGAKSFAKLYFLFLFAQFIITRRKKILDHPKEQLRKFMKNFAKSLLFGGGYLGICRAVICFVTKYYAYSELSAISSATLGGASLVFEPRERQPEIALFIFTNTLQTMYNMGRRRNYSVKIPHGMCLLYIISLSIICYHYFNNRSSLRRSYAQIMDKILGDC